MNFAVPVSTWNDSCCAARDKPKIGGYTNTNVYTNHACLLVRNPQAPWSKSCVAVWLQFSMCAFVEVCLSLSCLLNLHALVHVSVLFPPVQGRGSIGRCSCGVIFYNGLHTLNKPPEIKVLCMLCMKVLPQPLLLDFAQKVPTGSHRNRICGGQVPCGVGRRMRVCQVWIHLDLVLPLHLNYT